MFPIKKREIGLIKELFGEVSAQAYIKIIYISGSAARKTDIKGSDIDINVVYDDILYKDLRTDALAEALGRIDKAAAKYGLKLHIQPPKSLSLFWELIRSGEPWILTEIDGAIPVHDNSDFISSLQTLLRRSQLYRKHERSSILIDRAKLAFVQAENMLYSEAINVLTDTIVSNLQAILMYFDKFVPYEELPKELKRFLKKDLITPKQCEFFVLMIKLFKMHANGRKKYMLKHNLRIDSLLRDSIEFLERTEYLFELLEYLQKKEQVNMAYEEAMNLMKKAINKPIGADIKEDGIIMAFEAELGKRSFVPKAYINVFRRIMEMKRKADEKRFLEISSHDIHLSNTAIKHLEKLISENAADAGKGSPDSPNPGSRT